MTLAIFLALASAAPPEDPPLPPANPPVFVAPPIVPVWSPPPAPPAPPSVRMPFQRPRLILSPGDYFIAEDYPESAIALRHEGTVAVGIIVGPDGHVTQCVILRSSGWRELDAATCTLLTRRATFYPATDGEGRPTAGWFKWPPITWRLPEPEPEPNPPAAPEAHRPPSGLSGLSFARERARFASLGSYQRGS